MRITITTAGTKTGAATIRALLASGPADTEIHAMYRNLAKVPDEFSSQERFHAKQADLGRDDSTSLDFSGSDCVLAAVPPIVDGRHVVETTEAICLKIKEAVERAGTVKRVVLLSSVGAEFAEGTGELLSNNKSEQILSHTNVPELVFVRCAYFMENWTASLDSLKQTPEPFFPSVITPAEYAIPMVAVKDIGSALAQRLAAVDKPPTKPYIFELHGPRDYNSLDVQAAFSKSLGKQVQLQPIEKDGLAEFFGQVFPKATVPCYVDMTKSILPGGIAGMDSDLRDTSRDIVRGETSLDDAIHEAVSAGV